MINVSHFRFECLMFNENAIISNWIATFIFALNYEWNCKENGKMALSNIIMLSQIAGHVVVLILSLCILVPMSMHVHEFRWECVFMENIKYMNDFEEPVLMFYKIKNNLILVDIACCLRKAIGTRTMDCLKQSGLPVDFAIFPFWLASSCLSHRTLRSIGEYITDHLTNLELLFLMKSVWVSLVIADCLD